MNERENQKRNVEKWPKEKTKRDESSNKKNKKWKKFWKQQNTLNIIGANN